MALIPCAECGNMISDQAASCPNCGYSQIQKEAPSPPPTKTNTKTDDQVKGCGALIVILIIGYLGCQMCGSDTEANQPKKALTQDERIEAQFSVWDGAHIKLKDLVKTSMNDPKSFEHVESRYVLNANGNLTVSMQYRGKNGFGGVVPGVVVAECDIDGNVIKIISQN